MLHLFHCYEYEETIRKEYIISGISKDIIDDYTHRNNFIQKKIKIGLEFFLNICFECAIHYHNFRYTQN